VDLDASPEDDHAADDDEGMEKAETAAAEHRRLVQRCAAGLHAFCMAGQRGIWMAAPELYDQIYAAVRSLLVSDLEISRFFCLFFFLLF
jgi:hypothetical protein